MFRSWGLNPPFPLPLIAGARSEPGPSSSLVTSADGNAAGVRPETQPGSEAARADASAGAGYVLTGPKVAAEASVAGPVPARP